MFSCRFPSVCPHCIRITTSSSPSLRRRRESESGAKCKDLQPDRASDRDLPGKHPDPPAPMISPGPGYVAWQRLCRRAPAQSLCSCSREVSSVLDLLSFSASAPASTVEVELYTAPTYTPSTTPRPAASSPRTDSYGNRLSSSPGHPAHLLSALSLRRFPDRLAQDADREQGCKGRQGPHAVGHPPHRRWYGRVRRGASACFLPRPGNALSGMLMTRDGQACVCHPLDTIKVRMQLSRTGRGGVSIPSRSSRKAPGVDAMT